MPVSKSMSVLLIFQHSIVSSAWHGVNPGKNSDTAEMPHYHNSSTVLTSVDQMFDLKSQSDCLQISLAGLQPTVQSGIQR